MNLKTRYPGWRWIVLSMLVFTPLCLALLWQVIAWYISSIFWWLHLPYYPFSVERPALHLQVLDPAGKPIPNAAVLVVWWAPAMHGKPWCYRAELHTTDAQGKVHFPAWQDKIIPHFGDAVSARVYKPGWRQINTPMPNDDRPEFLTGDLRQPKTLRAKPWQSSDQDRVDYVVHELEPGLCGNHYPNSNADLRRFVLMQIEELQGLRTEPISDEELKKRDPKLPFTYDRQWVIERLKRIEIELASKR